MNRPMSFVSQNRSKVAVAAVGMGIALVSTTAFGLPWDIDMVDGQQRKAYSFDMPGLPAGVVAQPSMTSPKGFARNMVRGMPEGEALVNPVTDQDVVDSVGKNMYEIYCTPCHGADGITLGPVAKPGRMAGVVKLAGPTGAAKSRSDGFIYLTIRNGGGVMPSYGWAMSDVELWSTVAYVRTLEDAQYIAPEVP